MKRNGGFLIYLAVDFSSLKVKTSNRYVPGGLPSPFHCFSFRRRLSPRSPGSGRPFWVNEKPTTRCAFVRFLSRDIFKALLKPWFTDSTNLLADERGKIRGKTI